MQWDASGVASEEDERLELCPDSRAPFPPIQRNRLSGMRFTSIKVSGTNGR